MTREDRRPVGPGLVILFIIKLAVAIGPDIARRAPDVVRAMPPPRVAGDALAGFDGAALGRTADDHRLGQLGEVTFDGLVEVMQADGEESE